MVSIEVPPLRHRKEDIPALAQAFIAKFNGELQKHVTGIAGTALKLLQRYNWPGNIRELENNIERAVLFAATRLIEAEDLQVGEALSTSEPGRSAVVRLPLTGMALEEVERQTLIEALRLSNWVQSEAAAFLQDEPACDALQDQSARHRVPTRPSPLPECRRQLASGCT